MKSLISGLAFLCLVKTLFAVSVGSGETRALNSIVAQPQMRSICEGLNTSFSVLAEGDVLSYQWKVDVGFGYWELASGQTFTDVDKAELKVSSVNEQLDNYRFKCIIKFNNGDVIESEAAILHVLLTPEIIRHPSAIVACQNSDAVFEVSAKGSELTFQWQEDKNDGLGFKNISDSFPYSGASESILQISNVDACYTNYQYRCVVGGICEGSLKKTSNPAVLTVNKLMAITDNPDDGYTCMSKPLNERTVVFKVNATGTDLSYQWQVDAGFGFVSPPTTPIHSGINSPELTVSNITDAFDGYVYRCIVTSGCGGTLNSGAAVLKVSEGGPGNPGDFVSKSEYVIAGTDMPYSIDPVAGAASYDWTYKDAEGNMVPGVTIFGNGSNAVLLNFGTAASSGILSVCTVNGCGLSTPRSMAVTVSHSGTLPVEVISFDAALTREGFAELSWATASEHNNDRFEVEHSINGTDFIRVAAIPSKGNKDNRQYYRLVHQDLHAGNNYYRLKQYDKNGKSTDLGVEAVYLTLNAKENSIYPNPLTGKDFTIRFDTQEQSLPVIISNLTGQLIFSKVVDVRNGLLEVSLGEKPLPGIYLVRVGTRGMVQQVAVN